MAFPERVARNQAIFREVNERIAAVGEQPEGAVTLDLVCECSDTSCAERVSVAAGEYETVRSNPRRFLVFPGHVSHPELEREVARAPGYAVLEKFDEAGEAAAEMDPRNDG